MCDNTAPYTAQEVHLVTTKSKIVDKYTVEYKYITILTQAQSSLKHGKSVFKNGMWDKSEKVWHTRKNILNK